MKKKTLNKKNLKMKKKTNLKKKKNEEIEEKQNRIINITFGNDKRNKENSEE